MRFSEAQIWYNRTSNERLLSERFENPQQFLGLQQDLRMPFRDHE